jgi:arabinose-5-phosphate isomerase
MTKKTIHGDTLIIKAKQIVESEARAIGSLADQFDEKLEQVVTLLINCTGHVLVSGVGTSRAIAQRFAHLLSCSGTPALYINTTDCLHGGAGSITKDDVLFIISKGGRSDETNKLAEIARQREAKVICQTENPESPLGKLSNTIYHIETVGDVDPYGMIATGSSLVNGAAGDVLCAILLELRGYSKQEFGATHPGGAVGKKLAEEKGIDET